MRIRQERLDSNVRVSSLEVAISEAVMAADGIYVEEIVLALQNVQTRWLNTLRNEEIPAVEKESNDDNDGSTT